ncbi:TauD/TfdA family dioxygenase [Sphaerisporangium sp. NPDC049003]|uniref:TauD/TfdA family dioxygenase n=1 Tax=Sphaerisporangium sp. NPDC049003 TaxID=3364517 RepID=UPI0037223BBC
MPVPALNASARARLLPDFTGSPAKPIQVGDWSIPDAHDRRMIVESYRRRGYTVVQLARTVPTGQDLTAMAGALGLGEPFTPPLYAASSHTTGGISRLTADPNADHPFQNRAGQNVHCDGTLQQLGQIPTTVMICVRPAVNGGATYLFNAVAAYAELRHRDPAAAAQLDHDRALERRSTLVADQVTFGPAFAIDSCGLPITRYSRTATDTYHPADDRAALERALAFLETAARPGSRHRIDFSLDAGQALVLANDRIGHGRTAYRDDPDAPRLLLRGLFTLKPRA